MLLFVTTWMKLEGIILSEIKPDRYKYYITSLICVLVTQSCLTLCNPWTAAHQAPLSMGFSRQGYWSGLPFLSPGKLPDPGIEPRSPALQADSLPTELPWKLPTYTQNQEKNSQTQRSRVKWYLSGAVGQQKQGEDSQGAKSFSYNVNKF